MTSTPTTPPNPTTPIPPTISFAELGLSEPTLRAITELGYEEPTPIQARTIAQMRAGADIIAQAQTGTGKTAAFALPIIEALVPDSRAPQALVMTPTRELAMQVAEAIHSYGKTLGVSVLPVYGGQEIFHQLKRLKRGVDVVVATPGRALDHLRRKSLKLDNRSSLHKHNFSSFDSTMNNRWIRSKALWGCLRTSASK